MGMCPVEWEGRGSASSSGTELFATLTPDSVTTNFAFHFFLIAASLSSYHLNIIMAMHVQRQVGLRMQLCSTSCSYQLRLLLAYFPILALVQALDPQV